MASLLQTRSQFGVVVDFAVKNQPDAIGAALHWLMPGWRQIDDRKAAEPKTAAEIVETEFTRVIRATVLHLVAHFCDERYVYTPLACAVFPDSADAAHVSEVRSQRSEVGFWTLVFGQASVVSCQSLVVGRWAFDFRLSTFDSSSPTQTGTIAHLTFQGSLTFIVHAAVTEGRLEP